MAINSYVVNLTSDASGDATGSVRVNGILRRIINIPSSSVQPTDQYDITVTDEHSIQLFTDTGVGNAANESVIPAAAGTAGANAHLFAVSGNLNVVGANMGASKKAQVVFLVEDL